MYVHDWKEPNTFDSHLISEFCSACLNLLTMMRSLEVFTNNIRFKACSSKTVICDL